jgi:serine/threonine protein kinase
VGEAVAAANLADELERLGPLPAREAGVLAVQVARAVAALHDLGAVHGALSLDALRREAPPPSGRERHGRVRLLQFPQASDAHLLPPRAQVANEAEVERLGRRAAFVAPELLETDAVCDSRSDVYALGAIVYALLAGRGPCWTGTARSTLERAAGDGPEPLPDTVPPGLARVVTAMLASDPARRQSGPNARAMTPERQDFTALIGQAGEQVNGIYEADYRDFNRDSYIRGRETYDATYAAYKTLLLGVWRRDELAAKAAAAAGSAA